MEYDFFYNVCPSKTYILLGADIMPKIEIKNMEYFLDSVIIIIIFLFIVFLCFFIDKKWSKKIKKFLNVNNMI